MLLEKVDSINFYSNIERIEAMKPYEILFTDAIFDNLVEKDYLYAV